MLKLKLQYFGYLMQRTDWLEKTLSWERLKAGGEWDDRGWDGWMVSPTRWTWIWINSRSWWWTVKPGVLQSIGSQRVGLDWVTELNCPKACWRQESCMPYSLVFHGSAQGLFIHQQHEVNYIYLSVIMKIEWNNNICLLVVVYCYITNNPKPRGLK